MPALPVLWPLFFYQLACDICGSWLVDRVPAYNWVPPLLRLCLPPRLAPVSAFAESTGAEAGEANRRGVPSRT